MLVSGENLEVFVKVAPPASLYLGHGAGLHPAHNGPNHDGDPRTRAAFHLFRSNDFGFGI